MDIFGFGDQQIKTPLTADKALISWGGIVTGAINVSVSYAQQVQRRRTIGNKDAVIYASMPAGQVTMARLLTTDAGLLFSAPGWQACNPGTISISFGGGCDSAVGFVVTAIGCVVSQFQIQAEAEGLTVMDNVTIDFLQLIPS